MATKTSFADLQKRIKENERQLEEDRRLAESMRGDELKAFVDDWLSKADAQGFTVVEVVEAIRPHFPEKGKKGRGAKKTRADAGKKAEPKYRDIKTGDTWSGRGRPAGWLKAHMDAGKKKEDFLIKK
jgi:DNA-binding protein H-NS